MLKNIICSGTNVWLVKLVIFTCLMFTLPRAHGMAIIPDDTSTTSEVSTKSPYQISVEQYLLQHKDRFSIEEPASELELLKVVEEKKFTHVFYRQVFKGYPIFLSQLIFHLDENMHVYNVSGGTHRVPPDTPINPGISLEAAVTLARSALDNDDTWQAKQSDLVIYVSEIRSHLAFDLTLFRGLKRQRVLVDATDGQVLKILDGTPSQSLVPTGINLRK